MDVAQLARGLALNRISFGAGLILLPELYARSWGACVRRRDGRRLHRDRRRLRAVCPDERIRGGRPG
jgi:hypothetical protein